MTDHVAVGGNLSAVVRHGAERGDLEGGSVRTNPELNNVARSVLNLNVNYN